jgi:dihydroorotase
MRMKMRLLLSIALPLCLAAQPAGQNQPAAQTKVQLKYDLLLKGGRVIDAKNKLNAVRDVAISGGTIAAVAVNIPASEAGKTVDVSGLMVTPGLVDIHAHVYANTGEKSSYAGDNSVPPDGFTFRVGVTTVADAGCAGWRNFEDFQQRIISRSFTRVLVFINIVGNGMRGGKYEQDLDDMDGQLTGEMALKHKDVIVGIKSAHFAGPEWKPYEEAVKAGRLANIPVMIDYGSNRKERPIYDLFTKVLRPGDIYTHMYSGLRGEMDQTTNKPSAAMIEGRKRGIIFDVGHGSGSFNWGVAIPLMKAGFTPDSISTDLHIGSMNSSMKDMLNLMSKFLAMGMTVESVIERSTWNPAKEIHHEELGNLSVGGPADIAVLRMEKGKFGFVDMYGARLDSDRKLACEMTVRGGKVVYDLNGLTRERWDKLPPGYRVQGDPSWDRYARPVTQPH